MSIRRIGFLKAALLMLLLLAASLSIYQGFKNALKYSQDFQWSPSVIFWQGEDPYLESLLGNKSGRIILSQAPNYFHHFYIMLWPLAQMDFEGAKIAWFSLNIMLASLALLVLKKHASLGWLEFMLLSALFFMSTPFRNCLGNGQASIFVLFSLLMFWFSKGPFNGGWLAAGIVKYSFAPVFVIHSAMKKEIAVIVAMGLISASILFFGFHTNNFSMNLPIEPLLVATIKTSPGAADLMTLMRYDLGLSFPLVAAISMSLAFSVALFLKNADKDLWSFSIISIASLLLFQHLGYDYVFLLPAFVLLFSKSRQQLSRYSIAAVSVTILFFFFWTKIDAIFHLMTDFITRLVGASLLALSLFVLVRDHRRVYQAQDNRVGGSIPGG